MSSLLEQGKYLCKNYPCSLPFSWSVRVCPLLTKNPEICPWAWPIPSWGKIDLLGIYLEVKNLSNSHSYSHLLVLQQTDIESCHTLLFQICVCVFSFWLFPWPTLVTHIAWPGKGLSSQESVSGEGARSTAPIARSTSGW